MWQGDMLFSGPLPHTMSHLVKPIAAATAAAALHFLNHQSTGDPWRLVYHPAVKTPSGRRRQRAREIGKRSVMTERALGWTLLPLILLFPPVCHVFSTPLEEFKKKKRSLPLSHWLVELEVSQLAFRPIASFFWHLLLPCCCSATSCVAHLWGFHCKFTDKCTNWSGTNFFFFFLPICIFSVLKNQKSVKKKNNQRKLIQEQNSIIERTHSVQNLVTLEKMLLIVNSGCC